MVYHEHCRAKEFLYKDPRLIMRHENQEMVMLFVFLLLPGQTQFKVVVKSLSPKESARIYVPKPLDRNDGTFLVRYRMHETVHEGLKVEVLYGGEHVAQSPYILKGK